MTLYETINAGIKEAMGKRDLVRLETLRMLKSKILTVDARGGLSDAEVQKLFKTYLGNLHEAYDHAQKAQRNEIADKLKAEIAIVQEFLPKALTREETKLIVVQAITESRAKTKNDLGLVMKTVMMLNSGVDGKLARELASQLLADS